MSPVPLQTDLLLELRPVFTGVLCHHSRPMVRRGHLRILRLSRDGIASLKRVILIHSTFPDLPFFGQLIRLSDCPITSIATAKLPESWNAGDLLLNMLPL